MIPRKSLTRHALSVLVLAASVAALVAAEGEHHHLKQHHGDGGGHRGHHMPIDTRPGDGVVLDGHPRLANTVGYMSIAFWLAVYWDPSFDQIWLCFKQKSGDGLSLGFLIIWLLGDTTNLLGAIWQKLAPTMTLLALYYTFCDCVLIFQVYWYAWRRRVNPSAYPALPSESDPLLSAFSSGAGQQEEDGHAKVYNGSRYNWRDIAAYVVPLILIAVFGIVSWITGKDIKPGKSREVWDTDAQIVGWISAFLYLGSRIPQIFKNQQTKCHGLSLLMFAFSVGGNVTYVASILLQSLSADHLLINASWLVGSAGTIFLDFIVLGQFWYYASARKEALFVRDEPVSP